ncbi:MAG: Nif3-like dinuclear metal center hexameric protein [Chloroflexota bacterium]
MVTVHAVIDTILGAIPGSFASDTVDTLKAGDPSAEVTGIVTTFLASQAVLQKAVDLRANLIITHEPTFYNHPDRVDWLAGDPVYQAKYRFIAEHHLNIWRFHDNLHTCRPDPTFAGITAALGWGAYETQPAQYRLPPVTLHELAQALKTGLGASTLRVIGSPDLICRSAAVLVGAWGGINQMSLWRETDVDVLIVGETPEWETVEYARDAVLQGRAKALIVTGHANSEEPGMKWLVGWLRPMFPGLPVQHVPVGDPFRFV